MQFEWEELARRARVRARAGAGCECEWGAGRVDAVDQGGWVGMEKGEVYANGGGTAMHDVRACVIGVETDSERSGGCIRRGERVCFEFRWVAELFNLPAQNLS